MARKYFGTDGMRGEANKDLTIDGKPPYFRILVRNLNPISRDEDKGY